MSIDKENSLLKNNVIYDITKFTHLDYSDHLACIVWFSGCNMRCDYCYNKDIVFSKKGAYTYEDVLSFLKSRKNLLDGVVLSGGEATLHELVLFCEKIKEMGFLIKLDTNGTNYNNVKRLLELNLLDFVALDYKAPKDKFQKITYSNKYEDFSKTLDLLISSDINYEARTTLHEDLLDENDINIIIQDLVKRGYSKNYYIQNFLDTQSTIGDLSKPQNTFDKSLLVNDLNIIWR